MRVQLCSYKYFRVEREDVFFAAHIVPFVEILYDKKTWDNKDNNKLFVISFGWLFYTLFIRFYIPKK